MTRREWLRRWWLHGEGTTQVQPVAEVKEPGDADEPEKESASDCKDDGHPKPFRIIGFRGNGWVA